MLSERVVQLARRKKTIKPINLEATIQELLNEYGDDVYKCLDKSVDEVAEEAKLKLQQVSSFAPGGNPSGAYSKSWINEKLPVKRLESKQVVHNEDHYRLTHLLEKGHVIRNGTGRTFGRTGEYPHIAPVNDWANEELQRKVKQGVENL